MCPVVFVVCHQMWLFISACNFTSISSRYKVIKSMNLYLYFGFNTHYDWFKFLFFSHYNTARVFVNCADEFHTLRCRVVRCIYMIFLHTRSKKMCNSCAFVIQATNSSSWFVWFELLMKQLGRKMSLTQGIETHVSLSE